MVSVAALALTSCSSSSRAASTAAAQPDVAATLQHAAAAMEAIPSYRFTATIIVAGATTSVAGEFQAPDRVHETIKAPGSPTVEVVLAGSQTFVRQAGGAWLHRGSPSSPMQADPRAAFGPLSGAQQVSLVSGWYHFTLPQAAVAQLLQTGAAQTQVGIGSAHLTGRLIDELDLHLERAGHTADLSLRYFDVGTAPPVTEPVS